jgi:hypothetical protein
LTEFDGVRNQIDQYLLDSLPVNFEVVVDNAVAYFKLNVLDLGLTLHKLYSFLNDEKDVVVVKVNFKFPFFYQTSI